MLSTENRDSLNSNKIVPLAHVNSIISGQAPGGFVMGTNKIRRLTNEGSNLLGDYQAPANKLDIKNLAQDLGGLCAKEYNRRISDNKFKEIFQDNDKSNEDQHTKRGNMRDEGLPKSPQILQPQSQSMKSALAGLADSNSFLNNNTRDRLNSAFKKYDPKESNAEYHLGQFGEMHNNSYLKKNSDVEPSFGANSKHNKETAGQRADSTDMQESQDAEEPMVIDKDTRSQGQAADKRKESEADEKSYGQGKQENPENN